MTKKQWDQYWKSWKRLLRDMNDTQKHADSIEATIQKEITGSNNNFSGRLIVAADSVVIAKLKGCSHG